MSTKRQVEFSLRQDATAPSTYLPQTKGNFIRQRRDTLAQHTRYESEKTHNKHRSLTTVTSVLLAFAAHACAGADGTTSQEGPDSESPQPSTLIAPIPGGIGEFAYVEEDGDAVVDGDIVLGKVADLESTEKGHGVVTSLWPVIGGEITIPFKVHSSVPSTTENSQEIEEYDLESIMHYSSYAFTTDPNIRTIEKDNGNVILPNGTVSAGDITTVANLYD